MAAPQDELHQGGPGTTRYIIGAPRNQNDFPLHNPNGQYTYSPPNQANGNAATNMSDVPYESDGRYSSDSRTGRKRSLGGPNERSRSRTNGSTGKSSDSRSRQCKK